MSKATIELLTRLFIGVLNAINRKKKKEATDDPATTLSNGGRVLKSDLTFSELADKSGSDRAE